MNKVPMLLLLLAVAGCAEPPTGAPPRPSGPRIPAAAQGLASPAVQGNSGGAAALDANGKPVLFNDPPAAPDTPLCGRQAQELNAIGAGLQGARVAASGICARFACYDPLTATYLGADGYRHVCR